VKELAKSSGVRFEQKGFLKVSDKKRKDRLSDFDRTIEEEDV